MPDDLSSIEGLADKHLRALGRLHIVDLRGLADADPQATARGRAAHAPDRLHRLQHRPGGHRPGLRAATRARRLARPTDGARSAGGWCPVTTVLALIVGFLAGAAIMLQVKGWGTLAGEAGGACGSSSQGVSYGACPRGITR